MGGLQAMGAGIGHLGYFSWICAFSPVPLSVLGEEFDNALKQSSKINEQLHLFEIVTGDNDLLTGPATKQLENQLRALNI